MRTERISCCECGADIVMYDTLMDWFRADARRWFYCPHGHRQHFSSSKNDIDKMRLERDRLKQRQAMLEDEKLAAQRSAAAQKGQVTRLKNRLQAGVCPCCNRTFQNLQSHMKSKHPKFAGEKDAANVVVKLPIAN